jgi:hypothetical protein
MEINHERLEAKGWSAEEIAHAKQVFAQAKERKSKRLRMHEQAL